MTKPIDNRFNPIDQEVSKIEKKPKIGSRHVLTKTAKFTTSYDCQEEKKHRFK
jgi:hypothetical protein|tara:strand:- start:225 stop:383 length:159 start_codon:yes stop_codon:yes gene_type:complete